MNNYVNHIIRNYPLESETQSESSTYNDYNEHSMNGGKTSTKFNKTSDNKSNIQANIPTGGFPPIYQCSETDKDELIDDDKKKEREFQTHKTSVSIKNIMEKRRNVKPFIAV
jgi:maltooligosyltrehalose synthase